MSPAAIKRAAAWLRQQAQAQGLREANAARERLRLRARVASQPRTASGQWIGSTASGSVAATMGHAATTPDP